MTLLLTVSFATHAEIQLGQDKVRLLEKYQLELHELKIKVVQLETEVFLGGYHDLIERYQEIIKQLEYDVKVANDDSIPYSYLSQKFLSLLKVPYILADIDECVSESGSPCDPNEQCVNSDGSYKCACQDGFFRVANGSCVSEFPLQMCKYIIYENLKNTNISLFFTLK